MNKDAIASAESADLEQLNRECIFVKCSTPAIFAFSCLYNATPITHTVKNSLNLIAALYLLSNAFNLDVDISFPFLVSMDEKLGPRW